LFSSRAIGGIGVDNVRDVLMVRHSDVSVEVDAGVEDAIICPYSDGKAVVVQIKACFDSASMKLIPLLMVTGLHLIMTKFKCYKNIKKIELPSVKIVVFELFYK
jgi:hypothetical protein